MKLLHNSMGMLHMLPLALRVGTSTRFRALLGQRSSRQSGGDTVSWKGSVWKGCGASVSRCLLLCNLISECKERCQTHVVSQAAVLVQGYNGKNSPVEFTQWQRAAWEVLAGHPALRNVQFQLHLKVYACVQEAFWRHWHHPCQLFHCRIRCGVTAVRQAGVASQPVKAATAGADKTAR